MNFNYDPNAVLKRKIHVKYLLRFLETLPPSLISCDTTRMTIAYFAISGLDVLDALDLIDDKRKEEIIDWIYSLQVVDDNELVSGFQGSATVNTKYNKNKNALYKWSHLAGTYCGLCTLVILGDDLSRVNRIAIGKSLRILQLADGCYKGTKDGTENDMRFLFIAASICYLLKDWSGMDIDKAVNFVLDSISYDFGIAQGPELESHGGSTYCAIATLVLCNRLESLSEAQLTGLKRWLLNRQVEGFQGRPNKPVDTCYSFWIGATLKMLGVFELSDFKQNRSYVLATQNDIVGGFSKWVDSMSDPLHTYLGLAGLSLIGEEGLKEVVPALNVTYRAFEHLRVLHDRWT